MEKKDEILKKLAYVTDGFDRLAFKKTKITSTIYLEDIEYNEIFKMFSEKKMSENDIKFSIFIDNHEVIFIKIF